MIEAGSIIEAGGTLERLLREEWRGDPEVLDGMDATKVSAMLTEYPQLPAEDVAALLAEWKNAQVEQERSGGYRWRYPDTHDGDSGWLPVNRHDIDEAIYIYVKERKQR